MNCCWLQALPTVGSNGFWALPNIGMLITPLVALLAVWVTYRFAIKKMREETRVQLKRLKYERKLAALEGCWKLLAYTTEVENGQNILTWQKKEGATVWYLHKAQADAFIKALAAHFYGSGLGIYLPKGVKELLFEYRGILFGFLLKERTNNAEQVGIQNVAMIEQMKQLHQRLVEELKNETDGIEKGVKS